MTEESICLKGTILLNSVCDPFVLFSGTHDYDVKFILSVSESNISTTIGWIHMKFCRLIYGPQRMHSDDFRDALTFPLQPLEG